MPVFWPSLKCPSPIYLGVPNGPLNTDANNTPQIPQKMPSKKLEGRPMNSNLVYFGWPVGSRLGSRWMLVLSMIGLLFVWYAGGVGIIGLLLLGKPAVKCKLLKQKTITSKTIIQKQIKQKRTQRKSKPRAFCGGSRLPKPRNKLGGCAAPDPPSAGLRAPIKLHIAPSERHNPARDLPVYIYILKYWC